MPLALFLFLFLLAFPSPAHVPTGPMLTGSFTERSMGTASLGTTTLPFLVFLLNTFTPFRHSLVKEVYSIVFYNSIFIVCTSAFISTSTSASSSTSTTSRASGINNHLSSVLSAFPPRTNSRRYISSSPLHDCFFYISPLSFSLPFLSSFSDLPWFVCSRFSQYPTMHPVPCFRNPSSPLKRSWFDFHECPTVPSEFLCSTSINMSLVHSIPSYNPRFYFIFFSCFLCIPISSSKNTNSHKLGAPNPAYLFKMPLNAERTLNMSRDVCLL